MEVSLEVKGLNETEKALQRVSQHVSDGTLVKRAAYVIENQVKKNASGRPGPKVQTGRLRASITTEIRSADEARVGTNVFYASFVEFGHRQHPGQFVPPLGKRLVASFAPAYPYFGPAIEQTKDEIGDVMVTFGKELGAEWGK